MLQIENLILNFLLLVLRILLDFSSDAGYKSDRFFEILPKKGIEFVASRRNDTVVFNLNFMLLPTKVDHILEKQGYKKIMLGARDTSHIKIVLILLTKVVILHIGAIIV